MILEIFDVRLREESLLKPGVGMGVVVVQPCGERDTRWREHQGLQTSKLLDHLGITAAPPCARRNSRECARLQHEGVHVCEPSKEALDGEICLAHIQDIVALRIFSVLQRELKGLDLFPARRVAPPAC